MMRIPLTVPCIDCGEHIEVSMSLHDREISYKCSRGHENAGPVEGTVGEFVQRRAEHELKVTKEYAISMAFSAMAFECELSRLHHKWEHIGALERAEDVTDEDLDARLRRYPSIRDKIDAVACLLYPDGLDEFISRELCMADVIAQGYPSLKGQSLVDGFQRALFWPRNRILHLGFTKYDRPDAVRSLNVARLGLYAFNRMDEWKRSQST